MKMEAITTTTSSSSSNTSSPATSTLLAKATGGHDEHNSSQPLSAAPSASSSPGLSPSGKIWGRNINGTCEYFFFFLFLIFYFIFFIVGSFFFFPFGNWFVDFLLIWGFRGNGAFRFWWRFIWRGTDEYGVILIDWRYIGL